MAWNQEPQRDENVLWVVWSAGWGREVLALGSALRATVLRECCLGPQGQGHKGGDEAPDREEAWAAGSGEIVLWCPSERCGLVQAGL